jgi:hypothetical protein
MRCGAREWAQRGSESRHGSGVLGNGGCSWSLGGVAAAIGAVERESSRLN